MLTRVILAVAMTAAIATNCSASDSDNQRSSNFLGLPEVAAPERTQASVVPVYQDLLDTPASKSALAGKSLANGLARAGNRLVSVGERGHILYSDDEGKSWIQANVPVSSLLTAVHFPTPQKGWAVGQDGVVLHSSDGGVTWAKQFDGRAAAQVMQAYYAGKADAGTAEAVNRFLQEGPDKPFLSVFFENENSGFIVGAFNLIFRTDDGGKSWVPWYAKTDNPEQHHLFAIRQIGKDLYISGERGLVLRLDRKAERFREVKIPYNGTLFGITGKEGVLVTFGLRGKLFVSHNGGDSWQKVESGTEAGLNDGTVTEDGRIVVVSALGQVVISDDNGKSFKATMPPQPKPASAVIPLGKEKVVLGGLFGMQVLPVK